MKCVKTPLLCGVSIGARQSCFTELTELKQIKRFSYPHKDGLCIILCFQSKWPTLESVDRPVPTLFYRETPQMTADIKTFPLRQSFPEKGRSQPVRRDTQETSRWP